MKSTFCGQHTQEGWLIRNHPSCPSSSVQLVLSPRCIKGSGGKQRWKREISADRFKVLGEKDEWQELSSPLMSLFSKPVSLLGTPFHVICRGHLHNHIGLLSVKRLRGKYPERERARCVMWGKSQHDAISPYLILPLLCGLFWTSVFAIFTKAAKEGPIL